MVTMPVVMSRPEFEELVAEALDLIPAEFTKAMDNVVILVEDRHPDPEPVRPVPRGGADLPDVQLLRAPAGHHHHLPATDPGPRHDAASAREQVATTVIHEVAHHFGIDDDRLDELGWG